MDKDNPACYECPKGKNKIHYWLLSKDGTAECIKCKLKLTEAQADDVWHNDE